MWCISTILNIGVTYNVTHISYLMCEICKYSILNTTKFNMYDEENKICNYTL